MSKSFKITFKSRNWLFDPSFMQNKLWKRPCHGRHIFTFKLHVNMINFLGNNYNCIITTGISNPRLVIHSIPNIDDPTSKKQIIKTKSDYFHEPREKNDDNLISNMVSPGNGKFQFFGLMTHQHFDKNLFFSQIFALRSHL